MQDETQPPSDHDDDIFAKPVQLPESLRQNKRDSGWSSATDNETPPAPVVATGYQYLGASLQAIDFINKGLKEPRCTQIDSYGHKKFSAQVDGRHQIVENIGFGSYDDYMHWLKAMVDEANDVTSWEKIKEERMGVLSLKDGGRFTIFLEPTAKEPTFSLRKHTAGILPQQSFTETGVMTKTMFEFLRSLVAARVNILFVGSMGSGKSTLLRALASNIGDYEKIAVVEQVPELNLSKPLVVPYVYQPTVEGLKLADVLDFSLYNGLDRLIVGEVHLEGLTKMIETMIITSGSMSTYHADSTEQATTRMKIGIQKENPNFSAETAVEFIKQGIEVVVVLEKLDGKRRCSQITEVDWRSSGGANTIGGRDIFRYDRKDKKFRAENMPDPAGRIMTKARDKYGVHMPNEWFIDPDAVAKFQRS